MKNVKLGIAGLGRLGKKHAINLRNAVPGAELVAACTVADAEREFAKEQLGLMDERIYADYDAMCEAGDLDAIVIATPSAFHPAHIEKALEAGKHVFCEKPLAVSVELCEKTEAVVNRHPDKVFMLGFMRRFDDNYQYMKRLIDEGRIGKPYMVKATSLDNDADAPFFVNSGFIATSGGIFLDMASHDIDLMRWLLSDDPVSVYAVGTTVKYPGFKEQGDCENAFATYTFKNGSIAQLHVGRTSAHGYHIETEVIGTEGSIRVSPVPAKNLAYIYDKTGVRQQCVEGFVERFSQAYCDELVEFVTCILQGRKPNVCVHDGTCATRVAFATQKALTTGEIITI